MSGSGSGSGSGKVVCVTGASGFIASWIVKLLLHRGYTVRATVRDPSDPERTKHLRELDGATERLHLFKADLLDEGSFDAAIDGCHGVFHAASPVIFTVADPQADLIDPAVKGTLNVLRSCAKAGTVRRVVLTSSMAAVTNNGRPRTPDEFIDETCFSVPEICEKSKSWYSLSKTLAEKAAWEFSKENGIDMVSLNPGMVIGPLLQPTLNATCADIFNLINGSPTFPNSSFGWIHVKDVATAHILAFEVPSASGRYCLVERVMHYSELVAIIRDLYPSLQYPNKCADDQPYKPPYNFRSVKAKELDLSELIPIETSLKDTIESLREKGFISF